MLGEEKLFFETVNELYERIQQAGSSFAQTHFLFEDPEPFKNPVQLPVGAVIHDDI